MKRVKRKVTEALEFEDGLRVILVKDETGLPVEVSFGPGAVGAPMPPVLVERVAALLAAAREDAPGHYDEKVCASHGLYQRDPKTYRCPTCASEDTPAPVRVAQ